MAERTNRELALEWATAAQSSLAPMERLGVAQVHAILDLADAVREGNAERIKKAQKRGFNEGQRAR